jgi:hypothetical protein
MKFFSVVLIFITTNIFAQQASDYFPQQFGYTWNYRLSILDSLNNSIPDLTFNRKDSSAFLSEYNGRDAYNILTKTGTEETIQFLPYVDTNYVHLTDSNGYEYFKISEIEFLLTVIDSSTINNFLPFLGFLESMSDWHLNYKFAQNVNQQYPISSNDTTVIIDSLEIPLRFIKNGKRLEDEDLQTEIGLFSCKKFLITSSLNYLIILPPPLPSISVPIIIFNDTVWIAPGNWIVKNITPSSKIDLDFLNLGEYIIPGMQKEIISEVTGVSENLTKEMEFNLEQNYPNPFNPTTKIKFDLNKNGSVSIKVYDVLGKEVISLLNDELNIGNYEITFDGKNLSSGVYFYTLEFSDGKQDLTAKITKQMLLIK